MGRGRERLVSCEKCGRQVRRDKAVFLEKVVFNNPVDRKEVYDNQYTRMITREVAYCPSCGKHGRIYEKKKKMLEQQKERALLHPYASGPRVARSPYASPQPQKRVERPAEDESGVQGEVQAGAQGEEEQQAA